jgi:hypothetical protein
MSETNPSRFSSSVSSGDLIFDVIRGYQAGDATNERISLLGSAVSSSVTILGGQLAIASDLYSGAQRQVLNGAVDSLGQSGSE